MTKSSALAKGALAAAAGVAALAVAASASAQPPPPGPGYSNYDPCQRDANGRGVAGALIGGGAGAVLGSQIAAGGHRTDGSILGGVVGAIAGAVVGHNTAACTSAPPPPPGPPIADAGPPPPPPPGPQAYYDGPQAPPPPPPPGYYAPGPAVFVYGRHGMRYRVVMDRVGPDGCTVAESPIYLPDGRVEHRAVRVCPDDYGRYHIVG